MIWTVCTQDWSPCVFCSLCAEAHQPLWLDCGKSLLHTKLGSHHVFFAAMLHSQCVPHSVVTMLQNWLGLGHAAFVQKSWLHCGKVLGIVTTMWGTNSECSIAAKNTR